MATFDGLKSHNYKRYFFGGKVRPNCVERPKVNKRTNDNRPTRPTVNTTLSNSTLNSIKDRVDHKSQGHKFHQEELQWPAEWMQKDWYEQIMPSEL